MSSTFHYRCNAIWVREVRKQWLVPTDGKAAVTTVVYERASLNAQHAKPWNGLATAEKDLHEVPPFLRFLRFCFWKSWSQVWWYENMDPSLHLHGYGRWPSSKWFHKHDKDYNVLRWPPHQISILCGVRSFRTCGLASLFFQNGNSKEIRGQVSTEIGNHILRNERWDWSVCERERERKKEFEK